MASAEEPLIAPISGERCVAWQLELQHPARRTTWALVGSEQASVPFRIARGAVYVFTVMLPVVASLLSLGYFTAPRAP